MLTYEEALVKATEYLEKADNDRYVTDARANFARIAKTYIEYAKLVKS